MDDLTSKLIWEDYKKKLEKYKKLRNIFGIIELISIPFCIVSIILYFINKDDPGIGYGLFCQISSILLLISSGLNMYFNKRLTLGYFLKH